MDKLLKSISLPTIAVTFGLIYALHRRPMRDVQRLIYR